MLSWYNSFRIKEVTYVKPILSFSDRRTSVFLASQKHRAQNCPGNFGTHKT